VSNAYIRFLNLIDALDHMNPGRSLDSLEIQLLEFIVQQQAQNQATLHSRLKDLVLHGYVKLIADKKDARKKSVIPTRLAAKYIEFMSNCLEKSVKLT
jgi:DNA-binding MarR family transcriptional regulator